jgi:ATP-binding cassette subfamily F protein 3
MALLSIANLTYSIGDRRILDGVNLTIDEGLHVGMVGRNGCGKSTLLKIIAGVKNMAADGGQLQIARGTSIGYLAQDHNLDLTRTLREEAGTAFGELQAMQDKLHALADAMATAEGDALDRILKEYEDVEHKLQAAGGYAVDHQVDEALHGLGLTDEFFDVKVGDLSGGQRGRLALAKLLLSKPDLLLLDEPTNHLDIAGREWLEAFLAEYNGAVLLVSHDRWLLDRSVSRIVEIHLGRTVEYPGNYAKFRELRLERYLSQQKDFEKQQTKIKQEQQFIDRYRAGQRSKQAKGREKRLDRLKRDDILERPIELDTMNLRFGAVERCNDVVVTADNLSKSYDDKHLFQDLTMAIKRGDRVGIIGPNGAGKSTLVKCILGELEADRGRVRVGPQANIGHYKQTHDHLDLTKTVIEYLRPITRSQMEQEARDLAGAFLFSGQEQDKPMSVLSGGERSRAVLASLVSGSHNVLVLDEPTNHLDIPSSERLEEALRLFSEEPKGFGKATSGGGTLLLITHDRMLLENLVNQLLILDGKGHVKHFTGTYSEYVAAQKAKVIEASKAPTKPKPAPAPSKAPEPQKQAPANKSNKPANSALTKLNQKALESRIVEVERELSQVDQKLADPDAYRDGEKVRKLQAQRQRLVAELEPMEAEWIRRAETKG